MLIRALDHALSAPQGFDYEHVISIDPGFRGESAIGARTYLEALRRNLDNVPGVASVSVATNPPLGNRWSIMKVDIAGEVVDVHVNTVDPAFFETMTIPIVRGQSLIRGDANAVVISESLAQRQWPSENPVGRSLPFGKGTWTVAGVAGNARLVSPEDSDAVELYQLASDAALLSVVVLVKTSLPPEQVVGTLGLSC